MLFASIVLLVVGYSMVYAAPHGRWEFWKFFFPKSAVPSSSSAKATPAAGSVAA